MAFSNFIRRLFIFLPGNLQPGPENRNVLFIMKFFKFYKQISIPLCLFDPAAAL